ncbi:MAPEG family protein [Bradyrhizobium sp. U87765 SZCCT0131]|uniref:MAPEG family protein n=1 Tax=unclassified Bradyrhizobium TaxID=2631580 RepID=UPI001BA57B0E|nr:MULTISPECIES: MAPEG family protein [unclassified Bradyrhizobium]MBR1216946.1 MAPEG family protein [Bradyrhizobium sp. U87765 SZCCT0131]MBR1259298.1 MAPEG family protein [Bradyrhizobium sp. U87765 SZCCT0134]MBR1305439.1 MAPEG family protein [Bradyrhizobium sp. U87765 SZCCT0110]MBR1321225.1 MAPEG family protein [Bradyrhizobium sp. U87765 SZCCT0109]MBR1350121.1 MAPEG family protein [Bradyrhizobium sp. U87765 SZCCT0048]
MPFAYWCVLVAAVMPFVIVVAAKAGTGDDNHDPRDSVERLSPQRRRAYAAHLNAFENFPIFAAAVIIAVTQGASLTAVNALAALYVVLRAAHALLYIADRPAARSSVFALALLVNIAIFVLPAFR